eukprot:UN22939
MQFPNVVVFADTDNHAEGVYSCCPNDIYKNLGTSQYKWKFIPNKLFKMYPFAQYYFLVDDDVFLYKEGVMEFLRQKSPKPSDNTVVVSQYAAFASKEWSKRRCEKLSKTLSTSPE